MSAHSDRKYKFIYYRGEFGDNNEECDCSYDDNDAYDSYRDRYYDREYAERGE